MSSRRGPMARGKLVVKVTEPTRVAYAMLEFGDDTQREWVTADVGEVFTEEVGGSSQVAGGCGSDYFDVMTFPDQLAATDGIGGCVGEGGEVGNGEPEAGIGPHSPPQRRYRIRPSHGMLGLSVKGGGPGARSDGSTMLLDRGASEA